MGPMLLRVSFRTSKTPPQVTGDETSTPIPLSPHTNFISKLFKFAIASVHPTIKLSLFTQVLMRATPFSTQIRSKATSNRLTLVSGVHNERCRKTKKVLTGCTSYPYTSTVFLAGSLPSRPIIREWVSPG